MVNEDRDKSEQPAQADGQRLARYGEAVDKAFYGNVHDLWPTEVARAVMAVADAEQAELRAEVERLNNWREAYREGRVVRERANARVRAAERALADERAKVAPDLKGFTMRLDREEWGVIIDALIQHRGHADRRKAGNSESTSDLRSDMCADLIGRINDAAAPAGPEPETSDG